MEKVIVPMFGRYKCVILSDGKNHVFRADTGEFHEDVARLVKRKEPQLSDYRICGGGRVVVDQDDTIEVYGYSVDYGRMDKEIVEELISEYAKKEGLKFINNTGEGY